MTPTAIIDNALAALLERGKRDLGCTRKIREGITEMHNPTKNAKLIDALRDYEQADDEGILVLVSRQACDEAAKVIEAQDRDICMKPELTGLYEIRAGFGFGKYTDLTILAGVARELKHVISTAVGEKYSGEDIRDQVRRLAAKANVAA